MYLYLLNEENTNFYKIGITKNIKSRLSTINTGNPNKVKLYKQWKHKYYKEIEKNIHKKFNRQKIKGKEWFTLNKNDLLWIINIIEDEISNFDEKIRIRKNINNYM